MTAKSAIHTTAAPAPAHAFPQGVRKGPLLQVSGQGPVDSDTGEYLHRGNVKGQTLRTLENVHAILTAGGASFDDVIMLRVYLAHREDFHAMNEAYAEFVAARTGKEIPLPCRTTVICALPREEMLVEIDALAAVD